MNAIDNMVIGLLGGWFPGMILAIYGLIKYPVFESKVDKVNTIILLISSCGWWFIFLLFIFNRVIR